MLLSSTCYCLPSPMTLASQQIQGWQCDVYVGAVEEMMCVSVIEEHSGDGCDLASTLCRYDLRKGSLIGWARLRRLSRGQLPGDNRCMYMAHVFYVCYSDCVGVCGNVCCVAIVVKDSVFLSLGVLKYVVCFV